MNQDLVLSLGLPVTLFLLMFSMGTTLGTKDFLSIARAPASVATGLLSQFLLLPILALGVLSFLPLSPTLYAGFVILALSPGGTSSNMFSYLAGGNVALSISLTALGSLLAPFTLPFAAAWLLSDVLGESFTLPLLPTIGRLLVVTILPVCLGMALRHQNPGWCVRHEGWVTRIPLFMLLSVIGGIIVQNWADMPMLLAQTLSPALVLAGSALVVGYGFARLLRRHHRDAKTIAIETSIQNGGTAMLITGTILQNPAMTIAPVMYGILMLLPVFLWLGLRRPN